MVVEAIDIDGDLLETIELNWVNRTNYKGDDFYPVETGDDKNPSGSFWSGLGLVFIAVSLVLMGVNL